MGTAYEVITDRILKLLEAGTVPWHRPWGGDERHPRNLVSDKRYRGVNVFLLSAAGYEAPYWLTFKQARHRDGYVRKGERGFPCVFWKWVDRDDPDTGETTRHPFLRYYTVFNVEQCEGIEYPDLTIPDRVFSPIQRCQDVVANMPRAPPIGHGGVRAIYDPQSGRVQIPLRERFDGPEAYYSTMFHELVHSTGHESRLARPGITQSIVFGSRTYSKEELVAEMGATFLCGHTGIENAVIDNSASYIASWLGRLRNDSRLVVQSAAQSQKAVDYVLDRQVEAKSV
ncbi:MAG: DUF1738 domain-containing protein [Planctomycetes bacterium]|nr:DUF1738 domain-containing protein [Planctomycetota bacterium]